MNSVTSNASIAAPSWVILCQCDGSGPPNSRRFSVDLPATGAQSDRFAASLPATTAIAGS